MSLRLRRLVDADLDSVFEWERNSLAVQLAAFPQRPVEPGRVRRLLSERQERRVECPACSGTERASAGTVASFTVDGDREVSYWIDPARWGEGLATAALAALLTVETTRPLFARVAEHNVGSAKVLDRAGFVRVGAENSYVNGLGRHITEHIYQLSA